MNLFSPKGLEKQYRNSENTSVQSQPQKKSETVTPFMGQPSGSESAHYDIVIIGAGPSGLALANWFRDVEFCVLLIEKEYGTISHGQAEGLNSTSLEVFDSFGFGAPIRAEAFRLEEIASWCSKMIRNSDGSVGKSMVREEILKHRVPEHQKHCEFTLEQARVEHHLLENIESSDNITIKWSTEPTKLVLEAGKLEDHERYPITLSTRKIKRKQSCYASTSEPSEAKIFARYVIGCDGAHSWLRKELGVELEGEATDSVFGVMDVIPMTNFPDIRRVCHVRTAFGNIMMVPRPCREVRFYVPLKKSVMTFDPKEPNLGRLVEIVQEVMAPYAFEVASCSWCSPYQVGQRIGSRFSVANRAFLVGDAIHTNTPKAGQGMNASIQDANNLGWKLLGALRKEFPPCLLSTYESERLPVAHEVLNFERDSLKKTSTDRNGQGNTFLAARRFTTGLSIRYPSSKIVQVLRGQTAENPPPTLLKADLVAGKRLPDFDIVDHYDGRMIRIHQRFAAVGAFRLLVFAGNVTDFLGMQRLSQLGAWLNYSGRFQGLRHFTNGTRPLLDCILVYSSPRDDVVLESIPEIFRPWGEDGYLYDRIYADVERFHEGHVTVYQQLEIDPTNGAVVVVRPDGFVGAVSDFGHYKRDLGAFFWDLRTGACGTADQSCTCGPDAASSASSELGSAYDIVGADTPNTEHTTQSAAAEQSIEGRGEESAAKSGMAGSAAVAKLEKAAGPRSRQEFEIRTPRASEQPTGQLDISMSLLS